MARGGKASQVSRLLLVFFGFFWGGAGGWLGGCLFSVLLVLFFGRGKGGG